MKDLRAKVFEHTEELAREVEATETDKRLGFIGEIEDTRRAIEAVAIQPQLTEEPEYSEEVAEDDVHRRMINETEDIARAAR